MLISATPWRHIQAAGAVLVIHFCIALLLLQASHGLGWGPAAQSDASVWVTLIPDATVLTNPGRWSPNATHTSITSEALSEAEPMTPEPGPVTDKPLSTQQPAIPATLAAKDLDPLGGVGFAMAMGGLPGAVLNHDVFQGLQDRLRRLAALLPATALTPAMASVEATQSGAIAQVRLEQGTGSVEVDAMLTQALSVSDNLLLPQRGADRVIPGWYSLPPIDLRSDFAHEP